ncbi:hypothetical protein LOCC1_G001955 [Lachnellula occidentalis]|uniref:Uncharacterized protein n=1 Tax=Lachnellula occidentalis TaxID=215460 RepID=A0A8H8S5E5_9HELO|nr:hypothetical protein LOCC1_G001955 [Lachnellula occidentalis]
MPFEFVNNNASIDRVARSRIRSHVAIGRNVGKTIVRPSRKRMNELRVKAPIALILKAEKVAHDLENKQDVVPEIERQVGDGLSVFTFPEHVMPASKGLLQRAFSLFSGPLHAPELTYAIDATECRTTIWVQLMFQDEAYFHCALAVSLVALNKLVMKQEDPTEAIHHQSRTLRLINERLSGQDAVSDTNIAVVVALTQYDRLRGNYYNSLAHIQGLQRMIELRGGISKLAHSKPGITQKIFRADLEYSIQLGSATQFSIADVILGITSISGIPKSTKHDRQKIPRIFRCQGDVQFSAELLDLLIDITDFAWHLNDSSAEQRPKLKFYAFHDIILLLGYRFIHISPLGRPCLTSCLENALHLGLGAFIMTFLGGIDRKIADAPLLSELARSAAQGEFNDTPESQEVLLWILFIGAASIFKQADDIWLIPKTAHTIHVLGLCTWEDVAEKLARFPWVDALHSKVGQALWYKSTCCYKFIAVPSE